MQEDVAFWGYAVQQPKLEGATHMCESALSIGCRILREVADLQPMNVVLARRVPGDDARLRREFGLPLRFNADQHAIVLHRDWLAIPLRTADAKLRSILQRQVAGYWAREQPDTAEQVGRVLRARILSQDASAAVVASDLQVTRRTLNRRLAHEGTTFRSLVSEARYDISRELMSATTLPLTDIALALGYATQSAFTRAFTSWSGIGPRAWRAAQDTPAAA